MNDDNDAYLMPFIPSWALMDDVLRAVPDHLREAIEQIQAAAYERGRAIAEARAESRIALGLPLSREPREYADDGDRL